MADEQFTLRIRMIAADVIRNEYQAVAGDLLEYFEDSYVRRFRRNAPHRPPLFSIELWNMFNCTNEELPRTNNSIEGRLATQFSSKCFFPLPIVLDAFHAFFIHCVIAGLVCR